MEAVGAMPAATLTAVASFLVIKSGKDHEALFVQVMVFFV